MIFIRQRLHTLPTRRILDENHRRFRRTYHLILMQQDIRAMHRVMHVSNIPVNRPALQYRSMQFSPHVRAVEEMVLPRNERGVVPTVPNLCGRERERQFVLALDIVPGPVLPREEVVHQLVVEAGGRKPGE